MNQRQRAFCEAYLLSGNATEAAIKAGYSPKSARSIGQRLLTYVTSGSIWPSVTPRSSPRTQPPLRRYTAFGVSQ